MVDGFYETAQKMNASLDALEEERRVARKIIIEATLQVIQARGKKPTIMGVLNTLQGVQNDIEMRIEEMDFSELL